MFPSPLTTRGIFAEERIPPGSMLAECRLPRPPPAPLRSRRGFLLRGAVTIISAAGTSRRYGRSAPRDGDIRESPLNHRRADFKHRIISLARVSRSSKPPLQRARHSTRNYQRSRLFRRSTQTLGLSKRLRNFLKLLFFPFYFEYRTI